MLRTASILIIIFILGFIFIKSNNQEAVFDCPDYIFPFYNSYYDEGDLKAEAKYKKSTGNVLEEINESDFDLISKNCGAKTTFYSQEDTYGDYNLIAPLDNNKIFIVDMKGNQVKSWDTEYLPTNDISLLDDGSFLGIFKDENNTFDPMAGQGGTTQIINKDGEIDWEFDYYSEQYTTHHDIKSLPNGNILMLVWNSHSLDEARAKGFEGMQDVDLVSGLWFEKIIEVDPKTDEIVWSWDSFDYFTDQPEPNNNLPDIREITSRSKKPGDIMHANGLAYDQEKDLIFMSVNSYGEIWVINHKNKDLIRRLGIGLFTRLHYPNLLENGNLMVFDNGSRTSENPKSTIYEIKLPEDFYGDEDIEVVWSYSHPDLFFGFISGADRLPNGNTLIAEGDFGLWEINSDKNIVWQYKYNAAKPEYARFGSIWRPYRFMKTDKAILNLGL